MEKPHGAMSPLLVLAACLAVIAANSMPIKDVTKSSKSNGLQRDETEYRLKAEIIPSHYDITIKPQFKDDQTETFKGEVEINAHAHIETNKIVLHSDINIDTISEVVVCLKTESECVDIPLEDDPFHRNEDFLSIELKEPLSKGDEIITKISYEAYYPEGMYGFYKSTYTVETSSKEKREDFLLTTQFQPTHARKAFPCFDEPSYKATFTVTIEVPEGYNALSNAEQKNTREDGTKAVKTIAFITSPKMSTYLVAFIVYKEESFIPTTAVTGELHFQTWGRAALINSGLGVLSQTDGPLAIEKLEAYTNIPYTARSKKIDQAAIPDFSAGAMENWGLVTYRETAVLFDESEHTQSAKRRASEVIAHELAHQWFGNLVTTEWWDTIWLNEGFATFFEYYITDQIHPQWRMMERFVIDEQLAALSADESLTSSPLTNEVNSPEEITSNFGTITYSKGGSVLRMFYNILGAEKFRSALQDYLTANADGSVTPDLLFEALVANAGDVGLPQSADLAEIFKSWTNRQGFPLITVSRVNSNLVVKQEQFLTEETTLASEPYNVLLSWKSNDEDFEGNPLWLLQKETNINAPEEGKWVFVPTDGYFRVNYDEDNWALLTEELLDNRNDELDNAISPLERAILIDNALNFARTDKLPYSVAIPLLSSLEYELDYIPWAVALSGMNYLHRMLWKEGDTMDRFILFIINNVYEELGFEGASTDERSISDEQHIEHVHRANILNWACRVGHQHCISKAGEILQNYLDAEESVKVAPDLRSVAYCYGVKHDERLWTKLWKKLEETDDAAEIALIISALGCATNPNTLYMYLQRAVLEGATRTQNIASVFSSVNSNPEGLEVTLEFLDFKLSEIEERTTTVMNGMSSILRGTAQYIKTDEQKRKFEGIISKISDSVSKEIAENALASSEINFNWLVHKEDVISELEKVLEDRLNPTAPTTQGAWMSKPAALILALSVALPALASLL